MRSSTIKHWRFGDFGDSQDKHNCYVTPHGAPPPKTWIVAYFVILAKWQNIFNRHLMGTNQATLWSRFWARDWIRSHKYRRDVLARGRLFCDRLAFCRHQASRGGLAQGRHAARTRLFAVRVVEVWQQRPITLGKYKLTS